MTELMHFSSDELSAVAVVLGCSEGRDGYEVTLDRTVFHPQGGGQPSDIGYINEAMVRKVFVKDGQTLHCVSDSIEIGPVTLQVDAQKRNLHSRLHSAGHLIGNAVESLGLTAIRAHHWPGESRVLVAPSGSSIEVLTAPIIQQLVDTYIYQDLPRVINLREGHREVGFGDLTAFACGGTHVKFTGNIRRCLVSRVSNTSEGKWVRYTVD